MRAVRAVVPALALVAGCLAGGSLAGGTVAAGTPTPPGAGCIDPATAPTTVPVPTAAPTTLAPGAVPFTSPDGDFTVTFPGQPELEVIPGLGDDTTSWSYYAGPTAYMVSRTMLGAGETINLQGGCEGAVAQLGGKLVSSAPVTVDGHLGIELVTQAADGLAVQRIIDGGTAMYQLVVALPTGADPADPAVVAFFDSFHLTGGTVPATTAPTVEPTVAPTGAVPTIAAPTVAVPTIAVPTIAVPTINLPSTVVPIPTVVAPTDVSPSVVTPSDVTTAGASTTAPAASLPVGWIQYTSPTDGYTVGFPAEPEVSNQPMPTGDGGSVPLTTALVDATTRQWAVNSFVVPPQATFDVEAGRDGSLGDFSATLVSSDPIELDGRTGLEFVGTFTQDGQPATIVSRIYTDGTHVHQLIALAFGTIDAADAEVAGFFASFAFTGAPS